MSRHDRADPARPPLLARKMSATACFISPAMRLRYVTGATLTIDGGNSIGSLAVHQDKKSPL